MSRVYSFAVVLLCFALPSLGSAADFRLRAATSLNYDSVNDDANSRALFRLSTPMELQTKPDGRYSGRIEYRPTLETDMTRDWEVNWNHIVRADGNYSFSSRSRATALVSYADIGFLGINTPTAPDGTFDAFARTRRTLAGLNYAYGITPRVGLNVGVSYSRADFDDVARNASQTIAGNVDASYQLGHADSIAIGVGPSFSSFGASLRAQGEDVTNLRFYATWIHDFTKDLTLRLNGGPTVSLFQPQPFPELPVRQYTPTGGFLKFDPRCANQPFLSNCSPGVPAVVNDSTFAPLTAAEASNELKLVSIPGNRRSETQVNFFGSAVIAYTQARWNFDLGFRRTQSNDSGLGTSSAVNALWFNVFWKATDRWDFRLDTRVSRRESLTGGVSPSGDFFVEPGPVDLQGDPVAETRALASIANRRPVDIKQASVRLNASRYINRQLRATGSFLYLYNDRDLNSRRSKFNRFRVEILLQYSFDPVHL